MITLSAHQKRVLAARLEGMKTKEIADRFKVSEQSVKHTLGHVYKIIHIRLDSSMNHEEKLERIKKAWTEYEKRLEDLRGTPVRND